MPSAPAPVTVGLPVYNGARYLERAVRSILSQSYGDFELAISDNCSTDDTEELCRQFEAEDSRVVYLRHDQNRGAAWNYNHLVHQARGDFFKWASHDDLLGIEYLRCCVDVLSREERAVLAYPKTVLIDDTGKVLQHYADKIGTLDPHPLRRLYHVVRHLCLCNSVFGVYRSAALRQTGLIRPFSESDRVLPAEISLIGGIAEVPEYLFYGSSPI